MRTGATLQTYDMSGLVSSKHTSPIDGRLPRTIGRLASSWPISDILLGCTPFSGDHSVEDTPVPISNTAVKLHSGDGTWAIGPGRVARRREFFVKADPPIMAGPLFFMSADYADLRRFPEGD